MGQIVRPLLRLFHSGMPCQNGRCTLFGHDYIGGAVTFSTALALSLRSMNRESATSSRTELRATPTART